MMKRLLNKKTIAFALVCILLGTAIGFGGLKVSADERVVLTSPFTDAIEKVHASVVGVNNYAKRPSNPYGGFNNFGQFGGFGGFGFDFPFGFGDFDGYNRFGEDDGKEALFGAGSGVVVDKNFVVTNYHVVDGASRLTVVVGEKEHEAELVAFNEVKDVAVLKVKDLDLTPVTLGDSSKLQLGDWAIAIGNPVSLPGTTTVGIISSIDRKIATSDSTDRYGKRSENYNVMIQTDAAINSGNSGGGLFNTAGELIGIPTLKYTNRGGFSNAPIDGIGFAIPINEVKEIISNAVAGKGEMISKNSQNVAIAENPKPRMGITISDINPNSPAVQKGIIPQGISIRNVEKNSPAEKAGLMADDIIVDVDGNIVKNTKEMMSIMESKKADDVVKIKVYRIPNFNSNSDLANLEDGEYLDFDVQLQMLDGAKQ